ncbi:VOC family protein [Hyphomonas johnsonii]|uniref:Glyoxalase/bleomycin resistance protein/dioxygenase n=1 Tax=Hyphomonas johnsonii MHS-2 TaxID=1280950 RepID=A0A059FBE7_9PROT|nr:VOC family protein [Hyphomonas johnsonii]KCZ87917.1 glyoxalase/bleomycin resistance protein/dioxygenase [Hyphomonas johnsonii MHS-2]
MTKLPIIKVRDVIFPRLQAPDLDAMEAFLLDFGMLRARRTQDTLYMRGAGAAPFVHVTHLGPAGFRGFAFEAASREDLEKIAASDGFSKIEELDSPGKGWRTVAIDPIGLEVEVVFGIEQAPPSEAIEARKLNMGTRFQRIGEAQRIGRGPSRIKRFGHLQLNVPDPQASFTWYHERFGILISDTIDLAPNTPVAMFNRCDKGGEPADHHTILFTNSASTTNAIPGLNHVSWEVFDFDDVLAGHEYLEAKKRTAEWGVGRHLLGSQVFDYWSDPWGHIHEHWTDGDQLDASTPAGSHGLHDAAASQWGPDVPESYRRTSAKVVAG